MKFGSAEWWKDRTALLVVSLILAVAGLGVWARRGRVEFLDFGRRRVRRVVHGKPATAARG